MTLSAFGVDHGYSPADTTILAAADSAADRTSVAKSYIPGAGYGRAIDLSRFGRNELRIEAMSNKYRKPKDKSRFTRPRNGGASKEVSRAWRKANMPSREMGDQIEVSYKRTPRGQKDLTGEGWGNGLGGGKVNLYRAGRIENDGGETLRHELGHVTPKRNPYRLMERTQDPVRLGREEGRAVFLERGKRQPGAYPGNRDFTRGYNEVQRKMHEAKRRKP